MKHECSKVAIKSVIKKVITKITHLPTISFLNIKYILISTLHWMHNLRDQYGKAMSKNNKMHTT